MLNRSFIFVFRVEPTLLMLILCFSITCVLSSCWNAPDEPPHIEMVSVEPKQVISYQDSILFKFSYFDANGDLGTANPDQKNLFIEDSRIDVRYKYRIPLLIEEERKMAIEGEMSVAIPKTFVIGEGDSEAIIYSLWVVDRKGNESNKLVYDTVFVSR